MSYYQNITLVGPTQERIVSMFNDTGQVAYVSHTQRGITVVYLPWSGFEGNEHASELAKLFQCPAYAIHQYDSEIWLYWLYNENGELIDEYNSNPAHSQEDEGQVLPTGGNAALLCAVFDVPAKTQQVEAVLRYYPFIDGKFVGGADMKWPEQAQQEIAALLGISALAAVGTYEGIDTGINSRTNSYPELASFVKTGGDTAQS